MDNIISIHTFKRVKYLKDNILACEMVLKDLDSATNILIRHKDLSMVKRLLIDMKETHDNLFRFTIKQNNELKKLQESES